MIEEKTCMYCRHRCSPTSVDLVKLTDNLFSSQFNMAAEEAPLMRLGVAAMDRKARCVEQYCFRDK